MFATVEHAILSNNGKITDKFYRIGHFLYKLIKST
jgi:hypothetical protein